MSFRQIIKHMVSYPRETKFLREKLLIKPIAVVNGGINGAIMRRIRNLLIAFACNKFAMEIVLQATTM